MSRAEHADQILLDYLLGISLPVTYGMLFQHCRGEQTYGSSHEP